MSSNVLKELHVTALCLNLGVLKSIAEFLGEGQIILCFEMHKQIGQNIEK